MHDASDLCQIYIVNIHMIWISIASFKQLGIYVVIHVKTFSCSIVTFILPTAAGSKKKPKKSCSIGSCVVPGCTVAANDYK